MKKIKDEIRRIESAKGNVVLVNKKSYLALLKELSVLRFKVNRAENWETPAAVVSLVRRGYMYQYWYPENKPAQNKGEHKMAEQKNRSSRSQSRSRKSSRFPEIPRRKQDQRIWSAGLPE